MAHSGTLRKIQEIFLTLRLDRAVRPFAGSIQKVYCLTEFGTWKKKNVTPGMLKGYKNRYEMYSALADKEKLDKVCYLEFGVSKGESMRWWLQKNKNPESRFFGFDTFEGIPEAWGTKPKGSYTNEGNIPEVSDPRCRMIKGLFQDSLTPFLKEHTLPERLMVHLDADLYSATLFCLFSLQPYLKKGDLLLFDEFDITSHEFRAFKDFQSVFNMDYELVAESDNFNKIVLKIR